MYRNPLQQVQRFFHERHPNAFRLYNLCSERECVLRRGWCAAFAHVCVYVLLLLMAAVVTDAFAAVAQVRPGRFPRSRTPLPVR